MEGSFAWVLLSCSVHQAHRGPPLAGVLLCRLAHQSLKGAPWVRSCCSSVHQAFDGPASLLFSCLVCGEREAMVMSPSPTCDSALSPCFHGCPAFLHRHFPPQSTPPPHLLSICFFTVNSSPQPGISPQSPNSSSQPLCLPGDLHPCPRYVWLQQGLSDSHSI